MNPIADEIASYLGSAEMTDEEFLEHYGMPRRSGRYPWGSGKDPHQRTTDFLGRIEELKKSGWKETPENIKNEFGMNSTQYRREKSICKDERRMLDVATAKRLRDKEHLGNSEIGRRMGVRESTVRGWFKEDAESRMLQARNTADFLKQRVDEKKMIDVGVNSERELPDNLRVSRTKFDTALHLLEREGYHVYSNRIPQYNNKNQMTTQKVLCVPEIKAKEGQKVPKELFEYDKIHSITDYISRDGGETFEKKFHYPASMDSKRLKIRYADDKDIDGFTGKEKDGIVELRRGVADLSLGNSRYSQVRILVDGTHYIKGMAIYSDDMPKGVDVVFNTNKGRDKSKMEVLKEIKNDPDNPFGSSIKDADQGGQYWYKDPKTGKKKLGLINKRADEGDWSEWADTLPSQFLSKQSRQMAKKQLDLAKADKAAEFDEIMSLNNPTLKRHYLEKFASSCDGAAVDLKAAALPGQKYHAIIAINSLKDTEVYAPQYKEGSKLALVRYPHGGTFEIPILTVTHKNTLAKKVLGESMDAVGITSKIAEQLSGADFDGDTVMCIPTHDRKGRVRVASRDQLEGLVGFDPKVEYGFTKKVKDADGTVHYYRGSKEFKPMKEDAKNTEMGIISNLITDMTLFGANEDELAAAVRHSMVVIDAPKHKLDYRQSYIDNNIAKLQRDWQPKYDEKGNLIGAGGAASIVSKSKGQYTVNKRRGQPQINIKGKPWYDPKRPEGALIYKDAYDKDLYYAESKYDKKTGIKTITKTDGKKVSYNMNDKEARDKYEPVMKKDPDTGDVYFTNKDGSISYRTKARPFKSTRMAETDDAYTLVSKRRHPMEILYADHANYMKAMANKARKAMVNTGRLESNPTAKKIYQKEVSELEVKLNNALKNSPKERAVLRSTATEMKKRQETDPTLKGDKITKQSQRLISKYRDEVGAVSRRKRAIEITDREWEAIQAGAISDSKLKKILDNCDPDSLRERAMPKNRTTLSAAQVNRIKLMSNSNFTLTQIAEKMNLSPSTVSSYLKGAK